MTNPDKDGVQAPEPDAVREEAERLVAAGIAAVSVVADRIGAPTRERGGAAAAGFDALGDMLFGPAGHRRHTVANDSAECCRCPVCRMISVAREPNPKVTERFAAGVGTLAEGATRLLRVVAGAASAAAAAPPGPAPEPRQAAPAGPGGDPWAAATAQSVASAADRSAVLRSGPGQGADGAAADGAAA